MYFMTHNDSDTGLKFAYVQFDMEEAIEAQKAMATKYGFEAWRPGYWSLAGRFSSVVFKEAPDMKLWKLVKGDNEYMPRLTSKAGKSIDAEFSKMPWVPNWRLNECVGIKDQFGHIGVCWNHPDLLGFSVPDEWEFTCPADCREITRTEYLQTFSKEGTDGQQHK